MHPAFRQELARLFGWIFLCLSACFVQGGEGVVPNENSWDSYRTIMWIGDSAYKKPDSIPLFFQRIKELGINTGMVYGEADPSHAVSNGFPYYVENMVNKGLCLKWNSKVVDWDQFVTEWVKSGRPESGLVRDFCLDDPEWRKWAREQIQRVARNNAPNHPVAFDIRDELSITISANPFDYDFNPVALSGFRNWLRTQYRNLTELNQEWETGFGSWEEVQPFTTDRIKNRMATGEAEPRGRTDWQAVQALKFELSKARQGSTRWNFSPWADFRTYMDLSLARVLDDLRHAAHEAAPGVPVGIEGTQMPHAFGGYDCWRLSQALDWVEPYDIGNAREIFGSFMPNRPLMTTVFESDTLHASRRLWHLLLEGDRGCIIWWSEDCIDWQSADYSLTSKAQALAPVLKEMKSSLAALFLRAERLRDPIYIHYSQPSIQVDWLLESTADGSTWLRRFSSFEADYNRMAKVRNGWLKLFQDLGFSPVFVSSDQIERGCLDRAGSAVVVLPGSLAMSSKEVAAVRQFIRKATGSVAQRQVFFDGQPGIFDEHAKLRSRGPFPEAEAVVVGAFECGAFDSGGVEKAKELDMAKYGVERLGGGGAKWTAWLANKLESQVAEISVPAGSCTRVHRFKSGSARLVAFERNINYQMSEDLKQAGGNEALERPMEIEAGLSKAAHVYDLRQLKYLGQVSGLKFTLDAWRPSLFALTDSPLPTGNILEELEKLRLSQ